mmetsp:Transcript_52931/g.125981  ORF Transcript_52931/g.125981 Transcript_52931/m.125981 type:complete len:219 (+) Transcript_52931:883-1539(+)
MICIVAASEIRCCSSPPQASSRPAFWNCSLYLVSNTPFIESQKPSCHLKTVFFVTTYGITFMRRQRVKKMSARSFTLSTGLWYVTTAFSASLITRLSITFLDPSSAVKTVSTVPAPTVSNPAPYSPPTAWRSNRTGFSNPSLSPLMWIVSREMVMPFQPLRIAPLGDDRPFESPIAFTWREEGVTVGSLKIAPIRCPASTAACKTLSSVLSRFLQSSA